MNPVTRQFLRNRLIGGLIGLPLGLVIVGLVASHVGWIDGARFDIPNQTILAVALGLGIAAVIYFAVISLRNTFIDHQDALRGKKRDV